MVCYAVRWTTIKFIKGNRTLFLSILVFCVRLSFSLNLFGRDGVRG